MIEKYKNRKFWLTLVLLLTGITNAYAKNAFIPDGFSFSYGDGRPGNLRGYRGSLQWHWNWIACANRPLVTGYWDASFAHWNVDTTDDNEPGSINIIAFAPVFRLQTPPLMGYFTPYLEGSVGLSALSQNHLSHRNLGGNWAFQDLLGGGIAFGQHQQFNLSYHYLHYSNAGLNPPNNGIDVKNLVSFAYRFGC
jgi:lipid A 3-O-deacylase